MPILAAAVKSDEPLRLSVRDAGLPALVALTCASVNSYRRLAPHMWSSAFAV